MAYAVVINLDYENHPPEICSELWNVIKLGMLQAGFTCDGRRFTLNRPEHQVCSLARQVIDNIEDHLEYHRKHLYRFMKDFYAYDTEATVNLLVPADQTDMSLKVGVLS